MSRFKRRRSSRGGFGGGGFSMSRGFIRLGGAVGAAIIGVGVAALAKRFVGAPLGSLTGAAAGGAVGGISGLAGGWIHDNIGNVGGAGGAGIIPMYGG